MVPKGWTLKGHWLNFMMFIGGLATMIGPNVPDTWEAVPKAITPRAVIGFIIVASGFVNSVNTERPRKSYAERKTDATVIVDTTQDVTRG